MGNQLPKFVSKIDLVNAAQIEYDFLRQFDHYPAFYCLPFLENALYRYETYWLPLCSDHVREKLSAPLDVEWVWHCHILNPYAYAKDCDVLVNKLIDHKPYDGSQLERSKKYWQKKFPGVPFEVELNVSNPQLLSPNYKRKSSYDIIAACQRQRVFNYNSSLPHFRDRKFLTNAVKRYKIMLAIKRDNPKAFVVPCYDNDLIWHTHQQHVTIYKNDTGNILGKMLDHDDSTSDRSPGSELEKSSNMTKTLWEKAGQKFGVPGAMYRGEPPFPLVDKQNYRYISLANRSEYSFSTSQITRNMLNADHIKDVIHHISLMAPNSVYRERVPCEYNDNVLVNDTGVHSFTWRVVHCRNPTLSVIEILDIYGNVVSTAHTIGSLSCPLQDHVGDPRKCYTHNPRINRSMLIRGTYKDWGILQTSWVNFKKSINPGKLEAKLLIVNGKDSYWKTINSHDTKGKSYEWKFDSNNFGKVDFENGKITINRNTLNLPEQIALGCALAVSFVLCQPRPPPKKEGSEFKPYPEPPTNRPNVLHIDSMNLLVAGGLYASKLPRWYHTHCSGSHFFQIHPNLRKKRSNNYYGGCVAGDFGYDYDVCDSTNDNCESDDFAYDGDNGTGFDFDCGGGNWDSSDGDSGGCGGCGGGDSGGGVSCGGGDGGGGGGCGGGGGDGGGGGGCGGGGGGDGGGGGGCGGGGGGDGGGGGGCGGGGCGGGGCGGGGCGGGCGGD